MDVENSQFNNCSGQGISLLKRANLISVAFSAASLLVLLVFTALLVFYRAYRTTLQRLFLYLTIVTALDCTVSVLDVELQFGVDSVFCTWIGFGDVWTSNLIELFNFSFTVYLIITAYQRLKGREIQCLGGCRRHPVLTEGVCVTITIILPLGYLWVPFYHHSYGLAEAVCWIKKYQSNCDDVKDYALDSITFEILNLSLHIIVIITFIALIIALSVLIVKLRGSPRESAGTVGRALFLVVIIGITTCIRVAQCVVNIGTAFLHWKINDYLHDSINDCGYTISNLMVPLGFAVYLYSPSKLRIRSLKRAAKKWVCCCLRHRQKSKTKKKRTKSDPTRNGIIDDDGLESIESSIEQDIPSHTTGYSSPYTNEFTDITEIVSSHDCKSQSRRKYGSINP